MALEAGNDFVMSITTAGVVLLKQKSVEGLPPIWLVMVFILW